MVATITQTHVVTAVTVCHHIAAVDVYLTVVIDNVCNTEILYLFGVLRPFKHCTGHITTGSWKGRGNQYIQFVRVLYCKLQTNGKQLPAFPLQAVPGIEPRPQRWEARVLPLCHRGPQKHCKHKGKC